jgi:hypothetical protein
MALFWQLSARFFSQKTWVRFQTSSFIYGALFYVTTNLSHSFFLLPPSMIYNLSYLQSYLNKTLLSLSLFLTKRRVFVCVSVRHTSTNCRSQIKHFAPKVRLMYRYKRRLWTTALVHNFFKMCRYKHLFCYINTFWEYFKSY